MIRTPCFDLFRGARGSDAQNTLLPKPHVQGVQGLRAYNKLQRNDAQNTLLPKPQSRECRALFLGQVYVLRTPCFQNLGPGIDSRVLFVPRSPCISDRSAGPGGTQIIQQWHFASWVERVLHDLSEDPVRPCSSVLCLLDGSDAIFFDGAASGGRVLLDTRIAKSSNI